ncbi:unnamed protein product [Prunus armeniaca]
MEPEKFVETTRDEAMNQSMKEEITMVEKNSTWEMVERPGTKPIVGVRWIFKTKLNLDGSMQKYKARLVAKGYTQNPGVDFNETFAPVTRLDTIRTQIYLIAQRNWKLFQLDVKSAFLNGVLKDEVYIEQPEGFEALRAWYGEINTHLLKCRFRRSISEATLYVKTKKCIGTVIVSIYVDDIVYIGSSSEMIEEFKEDMMNKYEMTDLGLLHHFLGMGDCKPVSTPLVPTEKLKREDEFELADEETYRKIVKSLLYLTTTRHDIMYSVSLLACFMHGPSKKHFGATRRVLSDWSGSEEDMKSTSGYAFSFDSGVFSWASVKQSSVALSTTEVEYMSRSSCRYLHEGIAKRKILLSERVTRCEIGKPFRREC